MKPYRQCVAVALLRPAFACSPSGCEQLVEVLLVHKPRGADDWQLPQGGIESDETREHAAIRELSEEIGLQLPADQVFLTTTAVYQYDYPRSFVLKTHPPYRGQRVEFLGLRAPEGLRVTVDGDELDAHLWVLPHDLGKHIRRKEYLEFIGGVLATFTEKLTR